MLLMEARWSDASQYQSTMFGFSLSVRSRQPLGPLVVMENLMEVP